MATLQKTSVCETCLTSYSSEYDRFSQIWIHKCGLPTEKAKEMYDKIIDILAPLFPGKDVVERESKKLFELLKEGKSYVGFILSEEGRNKAQFVVSILSLAAARTFMRYNRKNNILVILPKKEPEHNNAQDTAVLCNILVRDLLTARLLNIGYPLVETTENENTLFTVRTHSVAGPYMTMTTAGKSSYIFFWSPEAPFSKSRLDLVGLTISHSKEGLDDFNEYMRTLEEE